MALSASAVYAAAKTKQALQSIPANTLSSSVNSATPGSKDSKIGSESSYTTTALGRWSLVDGKLPAADSIRSLHVYDFDNTLFKTPLPNPKLWNTVTMGFLSNQDTFVTGGWWHDSRILAATGEGIAKEEPRAWEGWWNDQVVELVKLTEKQPDALCVLLTGRSETGFGELIKRMAASKGLVFDMITLKPAVGPNNERFASTMAFKQAFLETLMETYPDAGGIRIYEDRPKHVKGFRDFLNEYNQRRQKQLDSTGAPRPAIDGEVIPVVDTSTTLNPVVEVAEVQHMVNGHNAAGGGNRGRLTIRKTVFFTGYLLKEADTKRLLSLLHVPPHVPQRDLKYHGNLIMICPRACPQHLLDKVGGMGNKMTWEVVALGSLDNVWAVSVRAVPSSAQYHVEGPTPIVVLAVGRNARPHDAGRIRKWHPVPRDKAYVFETTVGEKALLRVEPESGGDGGDGEHKAPKRKHPGPHRQGPNSNHRPSPTGPIPTQPAAFSAPRQPSGGFGPQGRGYHFQSAGRGGRGGMGGGGVFRGQGFSGSRGGYHGGGAMRGRGGGGVAGPGKGPGRPQGHGHFYQSLDDAGGAGAGASTRIAYDDGGQ